MPDLRYPALCQVNSRVRLTELSRKLGRPATLDDIPDADLDHAGTVLRSAAGGATRAGRTPGRLAIARMRACLGRQLDLGLLPGLRLARVRWRAAASDGELCAQPEPVLRPATVAVRRWRCWASLGQTD